MVQNATEDKEDIRSIIGCFCLQGCSQAELLIVGDSNKLVYITSRIEALSSNKLHYISFSLLSNGHCSLIRENPEFPEAFSKEINNIVARFLNSNITREIEQSRRF